MPSTRKQRAKERRSRQVDLMSDVEDLDVMLGSYSRNEMESNLVIEMMKWTSRPTGLGDT